MSEQIAASDAEKFVREYWQRVEYAETGLTPSGPCYVVIENVDHITAGSLLFMKHGQSKEDVFGAAYQFTLEHQQKIADVEEEIALLCGSILLGDREIAIMDRIVGARKYHLAELRRGVKE